MAKAPVSVQVKSEPTPTQVVESFLSALRALDMEGALAHLSEDIEYQNVPLPPDRGKKQVARTLKAFGLVTRQFEVHTHHIAERDGVVLTERTDVLRGKLIDVKIWVCGTFEVRDGKISLWRDHFDVGSFVFQLLTTPLRRLLRGR